MLDTYPTCKKASIIPLLSKSKCKSRFLIHHKGEEHTLLLRKKYNNKFNVPMKNEQLVDATLENKKLSKFGFLFFGQPYKQVLVALVHLKL